MPENPPKPRSVQAPQLAVVGSEMFGFAAVGLVIDFATGAVNRIPWATLILAPVGLIAGFVHLIQMVKKGPQA